MPRKIDPEEAAAVMRAAGLEPLTPYPGAATHWACRCLHCDETVRPTLSNVRRGQSGCRSCALTQRADKQQRALAVEAEQEMLQAGFKPLAEYPGRARDRWRSKCTRCGNIVYPSLDEARADGCAACAPRGLDLSRPVLVYVMEHPELGAVKVGLASVRSPRLKSLEARGWTTYRTAIFSVGKEAFNILHAVHTRIRAAGNHPHLSRTEMKGVAGWTETYEAARISAADCWRIVCEAQC